MAKDFTKTSSGSVKGGVKQMRGPGENLGLKKPRKKMAQPKDYGTPKASKKKPAFTGSYLPDPLGMGRKKKPKPF
jgi:hypothetical protein